MLDRGVQRISSWSGGGTRRHLGWISMLALAVPAWVAFGATQATGPDPEALWTAASQGDLETVRTSLEGGVGVDVIRRHNASALLMAAGGGHLEVVRELLDRGAEIDRRETFFGTTSLDKAMGSGHMEVARLLAARGASFDSEHLQQAIESGDRQLLESFRASRPLYAFEHRLVLKAAARATAGEKPDLLPWLEFWETQDGLPQVTFSATELRAFSGVFGLGEETVRVVYEPGGLVLEDPPGQRRSLVPVTERQFRVEPELDTAVFFLRRAGVVDGVTLVPSDGSPPRPYRKNEDAGLVVLESRPGEAAPVPLPELPRQRARPWPTFRGPRASGIGDGQGIEPRWNPATGEGVRFKTPIPGLGLSSPVVWNDRVYLTTTVSSGGDQSLRTGTYGDPTAVDESSPHSFRVLALDSHSGEIVWQKSLADEAPKAQRHLKSSHANSTAATDGHKVVVLFPTAGLVALDRAGEILWRQDLGALPSGTDDKIFQWGFASSPILWNGQVIVQADQQGDAYIAAWDLATGAPLWRTQRDEIPTWSTPNILERGEHAELITNGSTIRGYDPATGEELWSLGPNSEVIIATPIFDAERIYVTAGYPPVRAIYAIRPGSRGDLTLPPGETSSQSIAWSHDRGGGYMPTPILYRGLLYIPHHQGRLVAYEAATGKEVYRARFSAGGTLTGSPVAADGLLYFTTEQGQLYVVEAGTTYREMAVFDFDEAIMTTPALSDGVLYLRTQHHLWALDGNRSEAASPRAKTKDSGPQTR